MNPTSKLCLASVPPHTSSSSSSSSSPPAISFAATVRMKKTTTTEGVVVVGVTPDEDEDDETSGRGRGRGRGGNDADPVGTFARRTAVMVLTLTTLVGWRVFVGTQTLSVDPRTMKMTQSLRTATSRSALESHRARATAVVADAADIVARRQSMMMTTTSSSSSSSSSSSLATGVNTETGYAEALRRLRGVDEDLDFIANAGESDASMRNPCWRRESDDRVTCLPYFYVIGGWQSGTTELGARLERHAKNVAKVASPHFWNEHTKSLASYAATWTPSRDESAQQSLVFGDASPGYLVTSWSESIRLHRDYSERVSACWKKCQKLSAEYERAKEDAEEEAGANGRLRPTSEEDAKRRGTAKASPRRRCVDGVRDDEENYPGCIGMANAEDPFEERGGHGLSLPHLMSAVYEKSRTAPKFIVILREPGERMHSAYWHYNHYKSTYGENEEGFAAYAREMMKAFNACLEEHPLKGCANRFETYDADYEAVFYHADTLIKSLYVVFLETWFEVFPRQAFLVIRGEDLWSEDESTRRDAAARVVAHLNLGEDEDAARAIAATPPSAVAGSDEFIPNDSRRMDPKIRAELDDFFAPYNEKLAKLLRDEAFLFRGRDTF